MSVPFTVFTTSYMVALLSLVDLCGGVAAGGDVHEHVLAVLLILEPRRELERVFADDLQAVAVLLFAEVLAVFPGVPLCVAESVVCVPKVIHVAVSVTFVGSCFSGSHCSYLLVSVQSRLYHFVWEGLPPSCLFME